MSILRTFRGFVPWKVILSPKKLTFFGVIFIIILTLNSLSKTDVKHKKTTSKVHGVLRWDYWKKLFKSNKLGGKRSSSYLSNRQGFSMYHPRDVRLVSSQPISDYVYKNGSRPCLKQGTELVKERECVCNKNWFGKHCHIPESIHYSDQLSTKEFLKFRKSSARRIVYAAPFNHEFTMLEAILHDLHDLVDVFIFAESSYTSYGRRKPLRLLPRLHRGYLKQFHSKIIYLCIDHFPVGGRSKGFIADSYLRSYLGKHGIPHVRNLRDDDLFLVFDLDEIPSRDSLIFLKTHDQYPEPFGFRMRWSAFGFFWKHRHYSQIPAGCTIGMLRQVYHDDSNLVRDVHRGVTKNKSPEFREYRKNTLVKSWFMGENGGHFAGWHCSSCFDPEGIRLKFMSAQNADWPRWGSLKEKMELRFIKKMVKEGRWFDGAPLNNRQVAKMADAETDPFYAPPYILKNYDRFLYLLENPYVDEDFDEEEENSGMTLGRISTERIILGLLSFAFYLLLT